MWSSHHSCRRLSSLQYTRSPTNRVESAARDQMTRLRYGPRFSPPVWVSRPECRVEPCGPIMVDCSVPSTRDKMWMPAESKAAGQSSGFAFFSSWETSLVYYARSAVSTSPDSSSSRGKARHQFDPGRQEASASLAASGMDDSPLRGFGFLVRTTIGRNALSHVLLPASSNRCPELADAKHP